MPLAALDVQLRERFLSEARIEATSSSNVVLFHRGLRACDGGFGRGFVDRRRFERHVGEDGNRFARDLGKSFANREGGFPAPFRTRQLAGLSVVSTGTCCG